MFSPSFSTSLIEVPISNLIPDFNIISTKTLVISSSNLLKIGKSETIVTLTPKEVKIPAISTPIYPPPEIKIDSGSSSNSKNLSLLMVYSFPLKLAGILLPPVAIKIWSAVY